MTELRPVEPPRWNWLDTRSLLLVAVLFFALRLPNLTVWLLANVDEIALLNNLNLPAFSGGYGSTTFFPAAQFTDLLGIAFPDLRFVGVAVNLLALLLFFFALRRLSGRIAAVAGAVLFVVQWYLVYISRIYEIATFIPFFFALVLYLVVRWRNDNREGWLLAAFFVGGIGADCYSPPLVYALAALWLLLVVEALRKRLPWWAPLATAACSAIAMLPYYYVQMFVGDFSRDVLDNYQFAGRKLAGIAPIHVLHPQIYLKTLTELLTLLSADRSALPYMTALAMIMIVFVGVTSLGKEKADKRFIAFWALLTLSLVFVSPVAAYIQGHFTAFLLLFLALCALLCAEAVLERKFVLLLPTLAVLACSVVWLPNVEKNQAAQVAFLREIPAALSPMPISDGAMLALAHSIGLAAEGKAVFTCDKQEHIDAALRHLPCDREGMVVATFDCNIEQAMARTCAQKKEVMRLTTLLESHLTNGVAIYRTQPRGEANK